MPDIIREEKNTDLTEYADTTEVFLFRWYRRTQ